MPFQTFDIEAFVSMQKANVETMIAAQKIIFDLTQTIAKRQSELLKEAYGKFEVSMKGFDGKKQPAAYVDDAKAVIEKAVADAKETTDLALKAQTEVVDLFVKRATANFDHVKTLAA
jgi:phasin family protein